MKTVTFDETEFQVVPKHPVPEMLQAAINFDCLHNIRPKDVFTAKAIYTAMLAVAPVLNDQPLDDVAALSAHLRGLAADATPGMWKHGFPTTTGGVELREYTCDVSVGGCLIAHVSHGPMYPSEPFGSAQREANAAYIAAVRPEALIPLLDVLDNYLRTKGRSRA